jgi:hypothetical protein
MMRNLDTMAAVVLIGAAMPALGQQMTSPHEVIRAKS